MFLRLAVAGGRTNRSLERSAPFERIPRHVGEPRMKVPVKVQSRSSRRNAFKSESESEFVDEVKECLLFACLVFHSSCLTFHEGHQQTVWQIRTTQRGWKCRTVPVQVHQCPSTSSRLLGTGAGSSWTRYRCFLNKYWYEISNKWSE